MHYKRWKRHGDPTVGARVRFPDVCVIEGCDRTDIAARGWCQMHYQRWCKHGDPTVLLSGPGEQHPNWKGDDITYASAHERLRRLNGPASGHTCACGSPAREWAYDYADLDDKVGFDRGRLAIYSVKPEHYIAMCLSCHRRHDADIAMAAILIVRAQRG